MAPRTCQQTATGRMPLNTTETTAPQTAQRLGNKQTKRASPANLTATRAKADTGTWAKSNLFGQNQTRPLAENGHSHPKCQICTIRHCHISKTRHGHTSNTKHGHSTSSKIRCSRATSGQKQTRPCADINMAMHKQKLTQPHVHTRPYWGKRNSYPGKRNSHSGERNR